MIISEIPVNRPLFTFLAEYEAIHSSDIRSVKYFQNHFGEYWITASRDGSVKCWQWLRQVKAREGQPDTISKELKLISSHHEHAGFVNAVAVVSISPGGDYLEDFDEGDFVVASGGVDKVIYLWNPMKNSILGALIGHEGNICHLDIVNRKDYNHGFMVISTSWDGTVKCWMGTECYATLKGHEGAVWTLASLNNGRSLLTGSADKSIRLWNEEGRCSALFAGHEGAVRAICVLTEKDLRLKFADFVSAGNDGQIKFWKLSGECVYTVHNAHDSFIYTLVQYDNLFFSAGEDRQIKIWQLTNTVDIITCIQSLSLPTESIWELATSQKGEIAGACSNGSLYIFSPHEQAPASQLGEYRQKISQQKLAKQVLSGPNATMTSTTTLSQPGTKVGETKLVANPQTNTTEVFQWNGTTWEKIGDVVDGPSGGECATKTLYQGQEYDYVFDVELEQAGGLPLKLPYNQGNNPYVVATKFLADNNLGSEMLNQVVDFLLRNTGGASNQISYAPQHDPYHQSLPSESSNDERLVREVNVSGIIKKLEEFAKVEEKDNDTVALLVRELNKERPQLTMIESVVDMLNRWSIEHRFPLYDAIRVILLRHHQSLKEDFLRELLKSITQLPSESMPSVTTAARLLNNLLVDKTSGQILATVYSRQCLDFVKVAVHSTMKDTQLPINLILRLLENFKETKSISSELIDEMVNILTVGWRRIKDNEKLIKPLVDSTHQIFDLTSARKRSILIQEVEFALSRTDIELSPTMITKVLYLKGELNKKL